MNTSSIATPVRNTTTQDGQRVMISESKRHVEIAALTLMQTYVPPLTSFHDRVIQIYQKASTDVTNEEGKIIAFGLQGAPLWGHVAKQLRDEGRGNFKAMDIKLLVQTSERIMSKMARANKGLDIGLDDDGMFVKS